MSTTQEASGRGAYARLLHGRRVRHRSFPYATPRRGNTPLGRGGDAYFEREANLHELSAWVDCSKDKVGYEIGLNRHLCQHPPPRPPEELDAKLKKAEEKILRLLQEVTR